MNPQLFQLLRQLFPDSCDSHVNSQPNEPPSGQSNYRPACQGTRSCEKAGGYSHFWQGWMQLKY
jgi:hypothetical protein